MANLSAQTVQYLSGFPFIREIDPSSGPSGPNGVTSYWLVPTSGWSGDVRFPYDVSEDLKSQSYNKVTVDGIEYYRVPEESSNLPGRLSEYAQRTGVAELQNPPSGGVNRVAEGLEKTADATVDPEGVSKFVEENDNWEEARKTQNDLDAQVERQVTESPAREPAEGKLVVTDDGGSASQDTKSSSPAAKKQDNKS